MTRMEGLWTVEVDSVSGWSLGGVLVFEAGRILGGGDRYYCLGHYEEHGDKVRGEARCFHFHGPVFNAFGGTLLDFRITFSGRHAGEVFEGKVHSDHPATNPEMKLPFRLFWRADLPPPSTSAASPAKGL
jgi:hypothetical protein